MELTPDTFTILYVHIVFSVRDRRPVILPAFREELFRFITGIITNRGQKTIAVNGVADHIHILINFKPSVSLSDLVRDIKANSSRFINEKKWLRIKFEWQKGFGAFTVGQSNLSYVIAYIANQDQRHKKTTFQEEYDKLIRSFEE